MSGFSFRIDRDLPGGARAGVLNTPHGEIQTPAFAAVGTLASVKALSPEQIQETQTQTVLANTYHLYLKPGEGVVKKAGGLGAFMNWHGPTMTDSGGFQVFSLGAAFNTAVSKIARQEESQHVAVYDPELSSQHGRLAVVDDEGVTFTSHIDGTLHRFTPERSIEIQHAIGADIIFAFDECTAPNAPRAYQERALKRTHAWAERSLRAHRQKLQTPREQALFGIVQGGRFEDLRRFSAKTIGSMPFDGFGIGGSYVKEDLQNAVRWVCETLPQEKPRHLLGIGEPEDLVEGIQSGVDLFDCVLPTRLGRNGTFFTSSGKLNIHNARYKDDLSSIDDACSCSVCRFYSRAYLAHLFRAQEMLGATLASMHNLHFINTLVARLRKAILDGDLEHVASSILEGYTV